MTCYGFHWFPRVCTRTMALMLQNHLRQPHPPVMIYDSGAFKLMRIFTRTLLPLHVSWYWLELLSGYKACARFLTLPSLEHYYSAAEKFMGEWDVLLSAELRKKNRQRLFIYSEEMLVVPLLCNAEASGQTRYQVGLGSLLKRLSIFLTPETWWIFCQSFLLLEHPVQILMNSLYCWQRTISCLLR